MTATDTRMERPEAIAAARAFVDLLDGTYDRLIVAGSLRRRLARIGDVEVVAVPTIERVTGGMFGDEGLDVDRLDARMSALLDSGQVAKRLDRNGTPRWGPTLKYVDFGGVRVDLFTPSLDRFGWILLLRTGPAAYSRQLVVPRGRKTKDGRPGLLPDPILPRDGWLTYKRSGERIPTPEEADVFRLFDLSYLQAWERT